MGLLTALLDHRAARTVADRPAWALRLREARQAQDWTQGELVQQMRAGAEGTLTDNESLVRSIKRWEAGANSPSRFYRDLLSRTLGEPCGLLFLPESAGAADPSLAAAERALAAAERAEVLRELTEQAALRAEMESARAQLAQIIEAATQSLASIGPAAAFEEPEALQPAPERALKVVACAEETSQLMVTEVADLGDESCVDDAPEPEVRVMSVEDYDEDGWD